MGFIILYLSIYLAQQNLQIHQSASFKEAKQRFLHFDHQIIECDYYGMEYTDSIHDITLRIPEGAVPMGEKVQFEFAVAMYGSFKFPRNTQLISPVIWFCPLEDNVELEKPFQVILPHCLRNNVKKYNVRFAKAKHGVNCEKHFLCTFELINETTVLTSKENRDYGVVEMDHFCYLCITANKRADISKDISYCLARVELCESQTRYTIYYCGLFNLQTCVKVLFLFVCFMFHKLIILFLFNRLFVISILKRKDML